MATGESNKQLTRRDLIKLGAIGLAGAGLSMYGCGQSQPRESSPAASTGAAPAKTAPKRGGTLRSLQQQDFGSMWPMLSTGLSAWACYDTLLAWRKDERGRWSAQPRLAESWQFDDKKAIFKLRQGVKFHDGSDLDAEVVKWNIEMMRNHPRSILKGRLGGIDPKNPAQVLDKYTVQVNLIGAAPGLASEFTESYGGLAGSEIVSKAAYEKLGETGLERQAVGTGPFKFVNWQTGNQLVVQRFEDYWAPGEDGKALPYLDGITYRFIPNDSTRVLEMRSGSAEYTEIIAAKDVPSVKGSSDLVYLESEQANGTFLFFNPKSTPFGNNTKLRQAVEYAVDRESMAKVLGLGLGTVEKYDIFRPGSLGYDASAPYYAYDPEKAKQALKEAGYPNGVDLTYTMISREADLQQAEMMKEMLAGVGIRMTIDAMERIAYMDKTQKTRDFQMAGGISSRLFADPDARLTRFWADDSGNMNIPEVASCLTQARSSYDWEVRNKVYIACQKPMYDSAMYVYLWAMPFNYVITKRVKNFPKDIFNYLRREHELWLDS